jgi:hypothetical protein
MNPSYIALARIWPRFALVTYTQSLWKTEIR